MVATPFFNRRADPALSASTSPLVVINLPSKDNSPAESIIMLDVASPSVAITTLPPSSPPVIIADPSCPAEIIASFEIISIEAPAPAPDTETPELEILTLAPSLPAERLIEPTSKPSSIFASPVLILMSPEYAP